MMTTEEIIDASFALYGGGWRHTDSIEMLMDNYSSINEDEAARLQEALLDRTKDMMRPIIAARNEFALAYGHCESSDYDALGYIIDEINEAFPNLFDFHALAHRGSRAGERLARAFIDFDRAAELTLDRDWPDIVIEIADAFERAQEFLSFPEDEE